MGVLRYYRITSTVGIVRQGPSSPTVKRQKQSKAVTVGLLMSMMVESMIRRRAAYSTILLSDTLKKLISPSFAVILLRVVMLFLKGLCTPLLLSLAEPGSKQFDGKERHADDSLLSVFKCESTHTGSPTASYNDIDIHNAVCWAEALLDSHFSSLAFRASFHAPTREALSCVMRTGEIRISLLWLSRYRTSRILSSLTSTEKPCSVVHRLSPCLFTVLHTI